MAIDRYWPIKLNSYKDAFFMSKPLLTGGWILPILGYSILPVFVDANLPITNRSELLEYMASGKPKSQQEKYDELIAEMNKRLRPSGRNRISS